MSSLINANGTNRRQLLARAGLVGAAAIGAGLLNSGKANIASAALSTRFGPKGHRIDVNDTEILNFALNLEYLEAEFYLRATTGAGLSSEDTGGLGTLGAVTGGTQVPFNGNSLVYQYATEIAADELAHVRFLREALGKNAVARPAIDLQNSFTAAALAAGVITTGTFDPFASEENFLLGAFIFEDVGVTAYHGAAPYIQKAAYISPVTGVLAVEAYHASLVRTTLVSLGQTTPSLIIGADLISSARNTLSAAADDGTPINPANPETDQGVTDPNTGEANIVPADANAIAFARTFAEVLNIVYLGATTAPFGFFPNKMNGKIS